MDRDAVEQYLEFRWSKAGGKDEIPFTQGAVDAIAAWSHGIPRLINAICDNALLICFSESTRRVEIRHVRDACLELDLPTPASKLQVAPPPAVVVQPVQEVSPPTDPDPERGPGAGPTLSVESRPSLLKKWLRMGS
jgi:general secretion pathway protein A